MSALVLAPACAEPPAGIAETPEGDGPMVRWDLTAHPLPDLPLPNDIGTMPDPSSPTGVRLNVSIDAAGTEFEATLREKLNRLSGWGTSQPISIAFDGPIDIATILAGHRDWQSGDGSDYDFSNDVIYLIDVTPGSPTFKEPVPLDFGDGNFAETLRRADLFFEADVRVNTPVLLSEFADEDLNGNGKLDPGEDTDMDGRLDEPNVYEMLDGQPGVDPYADILTFYDKQTDTLTTRPLIPLQQKTTYAVVVTDRLTDEDGSAIRSPFKYVNHTTQTDDLMHAVDALGDIADLDEGDVAFAWTFTTQAIHDDMVMIRNGLYGSGPMSWLEDEFPATIHTVYPVRDPVDHLGEVVENQYMLPSDIIAAQVPLLASALFGAGDTSVMQATHQYPAYHVIGSFETPYFLDMEGEERVNGVWPSNLSDPEMRSRVGRREVYFWCVVPRWQHKIDGGLAASEEEARTTDGAPVVVYGHGYSNNRLEHLGGFTTNYAKFGMAGCGLDAPDHGIELTDETRLQIQTLFNEQKLSPLAEFFEIGRAPDLDFDGIVDSGDTWFGVDGFRTRDSFRQMVLDYMMLIRLMRTFDGESMMPVDVNGDGEDELAGDWNGDGVIDFGGHDVDYFATGTSLGGFMSSMLAGIEPSITAGAPVAGGAGGTALVLKSEQGGVYESFGLQSMGPAWVGVWDQDRGQTVVYQLFPNGNDDERHVVAYTDELNPGDVVMATNLETGAQRCARVADSGTISDQDRALPGLQLDNMFNRANLTLYQDGTSHTLDKGDYFQLMDGSFRVALPATAGDRVQLEIIEFDGEREPVEVDVDTLQCELKSSADVITTIDEWGVGGYYRGETYDDGDDLISLGSGLGLKRANPLLSRFVALAGMSVEAGDPVNYAPYYSKYPLNFVEDGEEFEKPPVNMLNIVTIGDPAVPVSTGTQISRAAGFFSIFDVDSRYGKTVNRMLIDNYVLEGIPWLDRFGGDYEGQLMDVENYSESTNTADPDSKDGVMDGFDVPRLDPPLRVKIATPNGSGNSGMSMPLIEADGMHAFIVGSNSQHQEFDIGMFMANQIAAYFWTGGDQVATNTCMEQVAGCDFLPTPLLFGDDLCEEDEECASGDCVYIEDEDQSRCAPEDL